MDSSADKPLISIICLCHNHESYVHESISSVFDQKYKNIELIVVDDGSNDQSKRVIKETIENTDIQFIDIHETIGNCKAFNLGWKASKGEYIIDLSADDLLLPERVTLGLETFEKSQIGVEFCNVQNINAAGSSLGHHFTSDQVQEGDLYETLIQKYFICPPGMMIKREVFEYLDGYDETLSFEDFDFWIRSSRKYAYGYTDEILVKKRIISGSHSANQFKFWSTHQRSTLKVCQKIKVLNRSKTEKAALQRRCLYEIKQCMRQGNFHLIPSFLRLVF